jgi:hypothetical protein
MKFPLKLDVQHRAYEINVFFDDVIFDSTQELAKRFELFVPVFRSPASPMTHPWYKRIAEFRKSQGTGI